MTDYTLNYLTPAGLFIAPLQVQSLDYIRKENDVGVLTAVIAGDYAPGYFKRDGVLEVWRSINGSFPYLDGETGWLIRKPSYATSASGEETITLEAYDFCDILRRRIIAYQAGNSYTHKLDFADDLMKDIVVENYGVSTLDALRNISSYLHVQTNVSLGPIVGDDIQHEVVLDTLQNFSNAAWEEGIRVLFDIVYQSVLNVEFRTYIDYRGNDHSSTSASPVIVSQDLGNLSEPMIVEDYSQEKNYAYAGGSGENDLQTIEEYGDTVRVGASPYNRCEIYADGGNTTDATILQSIAKDAVAAGKPRLILTGKIVDTPGFRYGLHYRYGDLVTAQYKGQIFNCRVSAIHVSVDNNGEKLDIQITGEKYG